MHKNIREIVVKLKKKKISLSLAESCTGGMLAEYITSVSGASKIFKFGVIAYSNKAKIEYLNVPFKVIKKYGAVSEECCYSMVSNLSKISKMHISTWANTLELETININIPKKAKTAPALDTDNINTDIEIRLLI